VNRERRRHPRTTLRKPILAQIGTAPVFVLDVSRGGLRVMHQAQLPPPGAICRVDVPTDGDPINLDCAIVHTVIEHATAAAKQLFSSGLQIVAGDETLVDRYEKIVRPTVKKRK
jgi:PilZ domain-containing protein